MKNRTKVAIVGVAVVGLAVVGCSSNKGGNVSNDQSTSNTQLGMYDQNQAVPVFDWSQYRQTLIDVENAQVHGMATTTFFFNMGVQDPIMVCPSLGFPIASTAQLTNPQQAINTYNNNEGAVVAQLEPNGVYTGNSTGTYVVCAASNGTKYIKYWEGFVDTVGGPAHWDAASKQEVLDGAPTVPVTTHK